MPEEREDEGKIEEVSEVPEERGRMKGRKKRRVSEVPEERGRMQGREMRRVS